jgi:endonuclease/exonuclease/phosphatase family metal-dependent hydrolase
MPSITDPPPPEIAAELAELRAQLDQDIPRKILDHNILIATWNLRAFGELTENWKAEPGDTPKRDLHALRCIAEIVSRFDVIAVQEVRGTLKCLRHMLKWMGGNWGLILTDETKGKSGNYERMAFLFDRRKVNISGLACELVVPQEQLDSIKPGALRRQFARTPYAVSFLSAGKTFILVTLHILYGKNEQERLPEVQAIADWLADWARDINGWDHNLIALGDFNIDRRDDLLYQAFTSTGLFTPDDLNKVPRTIFDDPQKPDKFTFYDQIAWFMGANNVPALSMKYNRGGTFDFVKVALKSLGLPRDQLSWRMSDHYPLWAEFMVND